MQLPYIRLGLTTIRPLWVAIAFTSCLLGLVFTGLSWANAQTPAPPPQPTVQEMDGESIWRGQPETPPHVQSEPAAPSRTVAQPLQADAYAGDFLAWAALHSNLVQWIPIDAIRTELNSERTREMAVGPFPEDVLLNADETLAYVTNADSNTISVVDLVQQTAVYTVVVGNRPREMALSWDQATLYVTNWADDTVSVVDMETLTVTATIAVGNEPWDIALSDDGQFAYVTNWGSPFRNTPGECLSVVELTTRKQVACIEIGDRPRSVAISPTEPDIAYVAYGVSRLSLRDFWIAVVDLANHRKLSDINLNSLCRPNCGAVNPQGLTVAANGTTAYYLNWDRGTLDILDLIQQKLIDTIPVGRRPWGMGISDDERHAYVANSGEATISVIDLAARREVGRIATGVWPQKVVLTKNNKVGYVPVAAENELTTVQFDLLLPDQQVKSIPVAEGPKDVEISSDHTRLYAINLWNGELDIIDLETGTQIASVLVGGEPHQLALSPDGTVAYVPNKAGDEVFVVDLMTQQVVDEIPTDPAPFGIELSPDGHLAYVTSWGSDHLNIIDMQTKTLLGRVRTGADPTATAITADGARAYVTNQKSDSVSIVDPAAFRRLGEIVVGDGPRNIALSPDERYAYVPNGEDGTLSIIDLVSEEVTATIDIGPGAYGIALSPDGRFGYITAFDADLLTVLDLASWTRVATIRTGAFPLFVKYVPALPPTAAGVDAWVDVQAHTGREEATLDIGYGNRGGAEATSVVLTATLDAGLGYLEAIPVPTISAGNILTWPLSDLMTHQQGKVTLRVTLPQDTQSRSIFLTLTTKDADAIPTDNTADVLLQSTINLYLPRITTSVSRANP